MELREFPEMEAGLNEVDQAWTRWAEEAYVRQLRDGIARTAREERFAFIAKELAKPLAIALREIPPGENWPTEIEAAIAELMKTDPAFYAIVSAQAQFVEDLVEVALRTPAA